MKRMLVLMMVIACASVAPANLLTNGDFDGNVDGWSSWGNLFVYGGPGWVTPNDFDAACLGWGNGNAIWQDPDVVYQADTVYTLTVVGSAPDTGNGATYEGMQLVFINATDGGDIVSLDYMFPDEDATAPFGPETPGNWRTATLTLDTAIETSVVGKNIRVGVRAIDDDASNGYLYFQNVSLVPEPATMVLLGLGSLIGLRRRR